MSDTIRFALRLPPELHRRLKARAMHEYRSINEQILYILDSSLEEPMSNTYRITTRADTDFVTRVDYLDYSADLDASSETETVGEFLIAAKDASHFEADLDASPAVVRWEMVAGNWPTPVR